MTLVNDVQGRKQHTGKLRYIFCSLPSFYEKLFSPFSPIFFFFQPTPQAEEKLPPIVSSWFLSVGSRRPSRHYFVSNSCLQHNSETLMQLSKDKYRKSSVRCGTTVGCWQHIYLSHSSKPCISVSMDAVYKLWQQCPAAMGMAKAHKRW